MPMMLPNLDDRRYADLVEEALAMIPIHAPEWTNHNASDPGIMLVELFAYLTEMLIYRLNRVTVENVVAFLNLIDASGINARERKLAEFRDRARLTEEVRKVVTDLRTPYRAITCDDYSELVIKIFPEKVARVFTTTLSEKRVSDKRIVDFIKVFVVPVIQSSVLTKRAEKYTEHPSDLRKPSNIPFQLISEPNEYLYIGMESIFDAIKFNLDGTVSNHKLKFEYSKGGNEDGKESENRASAQWSNLKDYKLADLTSSWASSGLIVFAPPDDWKESTVNAKTMLWVRVSAVASTEKHRTRQIVATAFQVAVQSAPALAGNRAQSLLNQIMNELDKRRLLTARVSVAEPSYKKIAVRRITLHLEQDALDEEVKKAAKEELSRFFHPLIGGRDGKGWPFGRNIYLSEIIERLAGLSGVDYVEPGTKPLLIIDSETGEAKEQPGNSITVKPFELVDFRILETQITTVSAENPHTPRLT
jgi:hypothetical protein